MARKKKQSKRISRILSLVVFLLILLAALVAYLNPDLLEQPQTEDPAPTPPETTTMGEMQVHVIDVGQGDAILITAPEGNILIDAGDNVARYEQALKNYLDGLGIKKLDYFVLTHPDADHIGGADMILKNYTVGTVIMPDKPHTTKVYEAVLDALEANGADLELAEAGTMFSLGDLKCKILAPLKIYSDKNDCSVVIRATFGEVSMMFTGDAEGNKEGQAEKDILAKYPATELKCDFLKVGHHGSDTSTSPAFLTAVSPKIAAISCGAGNKYGHPVQSVLDTLNAAGVTVYRTDLSGTLVFVCDGTTIEYRK
ncbi:MAG: MBL fold metallo-hydrolase [Clostridia bacterium]|nr:MBL fold metallo-hydrolase [Clostridia bacterium]